MGAIVEHQETDNLIFANTITTKWEAFGIDPNTNSLLQLEFFYATKPWSFRSHLLKYIASADRFPKVDRLDFVAHIIRDEPKLSVEYEACRIMDDEAKLGMNVLGAKNYLEWWEKNRPNYVTNTPAAHP